MLRKLLRSVNDERVAAASHRCPGPSNSNCSHATGRDGWSLSEGKAPAERPATGLCESAKRKDTVEATQLDVAPHWQGGAVEEQRSLPGSSPQRAERRHALTVRGGESEAGPCPLVERMGKSYNRVAQAVGRSCFPWSELIPGRQQWLTRLSFTLHPAGTVLSSG